MALSNFDSFSLRFDRNDLTWWTGETISGSIEIRAKEDCKCNGIIVKLIFVAHGAGNLSSSNVDTTTTKCGSFTAGETKTLPFSFQIPQGPVTYHGDKLNVDWYIQVAIDIPWALDPTHKSKFLVLPGPNASTYHPKGHTPTIARTRLTKASLLGLVLLAMGGSLLYFVITDLDSYGSGIFVSGFLIFLGMICLLTDLRNLVASSSLGHVAVSHSPSAPRGGDTVEITTTFTPRKSGEINNIVTQLVAEEIVLHTTSSGKNSTTTRYTSIRSSQEQRISGPIQLRKGHRALFKQSFVIPEDAPPSFMTVDNQLEWSARIAIDVPNWPDWEDNHEIIVSSREQPRVADRNE